MKKIAGSFLSSNLDEKEIIKQFNHTDMDQIHLDIMDGSITKNVHILPEELSSYLDQCQKPVNAHLMVKNPSSYLPILIKNPKVVQIALHVECENTKQNLKKIQASSKKVGVALLKESPLSLLKDYLSWVDYVLLLSVPIGKSGQSFAPETEEKIKKLTLLRKANHNFFEIWVDGGIDDSTLKYVEKADGLISGSYLQQDPKNHTSLLKK